MGVDGDTFMWSENYHIHGKKGVDDEPSWIIDTLSGIYNKSAGETEDGEW